MLNTVKELCALSGIGGWEDEVREYIRTRAARHADELRVDTLGNLIVFKKGKKATGNKLMLCAHMDEVGLIVSQITDDGFLKFKCVGGIDPRVLVSKKVRIGRKSICGVIGAKAIHLQKKSEREQVPKVENLYIDIGAKDKDSASSLVSVGDYCVFDSAFVSFGDGFIKAKALDDRAGCNCLMALAKEEFDCDLYLVFTVQEEVGLRGARVASEYVAPDIAIVLEGTTCSDVYGSEERDFSTIAGGGAVLSIIDRSTYYDKELTNALYETAKKHDISVQWKQTASGGNDAGAVHLAAGGIKTAAISVPARYIHSPSSVIKQSDLEAVYALISTFLREGLAQ